MRQNIMGHRSKERATNTPFRGISWNKERKNWSAYISINGMQKGLGRYDTEFEAAIARDDAAFKNGYPLEGLNFPSIFKDVV